MTDIQKDSNKDVREEKSVSSKALTENFRPFFFNDYHTFVIQKTEKLASALYVITGFIPSEEPVRLKLRTCALDLITHTCEPNRFAEKGADQFASRCAEIGSILDTAIHAGLVSRMNAELICNEYASLAHFVRSNRSRISESKQGGEGIGSDQLSLRSPMEDNQFKSYGLKEIFKGHKIAPKKRQNDRRTAVLNVFKNKDKVSIKDVVSSVIGCSEKTVQRVLLSLVQEGVLLKEGARRWTTYKKAS